jgi:periplasmic copper chaperone A
VTDSRRTAARRSALPVIAGALSVLLVSCSLVSCSATSGPGAGTPELSVGRVQASAPIAGASQLVLELVNSGDGADRLVGADTPAALAVEVHLTEITADGRAVMRMLDDLEIAPGERVTFRPGALHLMVVVPDATVVVGGTFEVTLRFERSAPITVVATVVDLLDLVEGSDGPAA